MIKIDIDKFTEAEFIDLNHRIVARLRFLNEMPAHAEIREFKIGDRVPFQPDRRLVMVGMLTGYNQKTVTVITDIGQQWNVAPRALRGAGRFVRWRSQQSECDPVVRDIVNFERLRVNHGDRHRED